MNKPQQFKVSTPVGSIESDSGNHYVDIISVLCFIIIIVALKKVISKYIK